MQAGIRDPRWPSQVSVYNEAKPSRDMLRTEYVAAEGGRWHEQELRLRVM